MSRSLVGLFRKEWRQHGNSALATIIACFAVCAFVFVLAAFDGHFAAPEFYLGVALYIALLYTWAIAASIYAIEHEKNTFSFLRNLPVSPLTIAIGKIGFALCAAGLVLAANLLSCALFCVLPGGVIGLGVHKDTITVMLLVLGTGMAEIFVWSIFWSTRCRNCGLATLAACACAVLAFVIILQFVPGSASEIEMFSAVQPIRLAVIMVVAILAGWGALRWFDFGIKDTRNVWIPRNFVFARYPKQVQPPFLALVHQHLRHVSLVYPLGIAFFFIFSLACILQCFLDIANFLRHLFLIGFFIVPMGILIFWGNIFGHDQRNGSYRFLARIGIHAGKVWWSRMLPATLLYIPVLACLLVCKFVYAGGNEEFFFNAQFAFVVWLTVLATGALGSISCEKQMTGIGATMMLCYLILFPWMLLFLFSFGSSPLWTTVPLALACLLASRLRAGDWLREIKTWRSRFIPLLPVFAAVLLVFIAVPFVRVYSVPYVSWEHLNAYLAEAPNSDHELLMQNYTKQRDFARLVFSGQILEKIPDTDPDFATYFMLRLMPWEEARRERFLRIQIVAALAESGAIRDDRALSLCRYYAMQAYPKHHLRMGPPGPGGIFDDVWGRWH
ncbi:MAG: hypothetical protein FWG73_09160 [Planctomycetaceae bacterium]|nr:hypothetical protein [Planctomycetaceae bacterium]